jgi:dTDP-D-glucose 4,6-dehydratase
MITKKMKQVGFIVYGGGLNVREWLDRAKADGFSIMIRETFAEIWK